MWREGLAKLTEYGAGYLALACTQVTGTNSAVPSTALGGVRLDFLSSSLGEKQEPVQEKKKRKEEEQPGAGLGCVGCVGD